MLVSVYLVMLINLHLICGHIKIPEMKCKQQSKSHVPLARKTFHLYFWIYLPSLLCQLQTLYYYILSVCSNFIWFSVTQLLQLLCQGKPYSHLTFSLFNHFLLLWHHHLYLEFCAYFEFNGLPLVWRLVYTIPGVLFVFTGSFNFPYWC